MGSGYLLVCCRGVPAIILIITYIKPTCLHARQGDTWYGICALLSCESISSISVYVLLWEVGWRRIRHLEEGGEKPVALHFLIPAHERKHYRQKEKNSVTCLSLSPRKNRHLYALHTIKGIKLFLFVCICHRKQNMPTKQKTDKTRFLLLLAGHGGLCCGCIKHIFSCLSLSCRHFLLSPSLLKDTLSPPLPPSLLPAYTVLVSARCAPLARASRHFGPPCAAACTWRAWRGMATHRRAPPSRAFA